MRLPAVPGGGALRALRRPSEGLQYAGLIGASVVTAALITVVAYQFSPVVALALPVAAGIGIVICLWPMAGVYLAVLAVPLERVAVPAGAAAELTPTKALLVVIAIVAMARWIIDREPHPGLDRIHYAYIGLLGAMAVGIAFAPDAFLTTKLFVQWAAFGAVAVLISRSDRSQLQKLFVCVAIAGGVLGLIAAATSSQQTLVAGGQAVQGRAQAGFAHPAVLAFFLVLAFPPAIALALSGRAWQRPLGALCAALAAAGIMFSLTRGAILALAVALLVLLFWAPFRRWAITLLAVVVLFSVFNAGAIQKSPQLEVIATRIGTIGDTKATQDNQRPYIWAKTPEMIVDHPFFGVGAGQFPVYAPRYAIVDYGGLPFLHAHNVLLTIAAENGLIGLGFLIWLGLTIVARGLRTIASKRDHPAFPYAVATTAALFGSFVTGMIDYPPNTVVIMGMIMVMVGAFVAAQRLVAEPD
jgi:O-antigen ligase